MTPTIPTATVADTPGVMTLDAFIERYAAEGPFELIDGEIIPKMPTVSGHSKLTKKLFRLLLPFEDQGLGEVFMETTFILLDLPNWVKGSRVPDVMFITREKLARFAQDVPDADAKPFVCVPDLVIEVVSPTDRYTDINNRVTRYLNDGVRLLWVVDPAGRAIFVYMAGSNVQTKLTRAMMLDGGEVLPGFAVSLAEIF
jgi:Uma2 family endonuclease